MREKTKAQGIYQRLIDSSSSRYSSQYSNSSPFQGRVNALFCWDFYIYTAYNLCVWDYTQISHFQLQRPDGQGQNANQILGYAPSLISWVAVLSTAQEHNMSILSFSLSS
jgi:hypothetical protein